MTLVGACLALLAVGASPASAVLYRLPGGHYTSYEGILGKRTPSNIKVSPPQQAQAFSTTSDFFHDSLGYLGYSGGPVMTSNRNYVVDWEPSNYNGPPHESGQNCGFADSNGNYNTPCTGYVQGVGTFFQDLQASSGSNSISDAVAAQYTSAGATPGTPNFSSTYGGTLTDHDPLPAQNGCPASPSVSGGRCLTDAQIQSELQSFLSAQGKPAGLTNEYFMLTPPGIVTCFDGGGQTCSGNAGPGGNAIFCAYHNRTSTASHYVFSNIPDMDNIAGCDPFVSGSPSGNNDVCDAGTVCIFPNGWADGVVSAVSHEHNESITDPEPDNAWADYSQLRNQPGDENGDKCNADAPDDPNTQWNFANFALDATPWDEHIGSHDYWIQMQWSNQNLQCTSHWTPTASPGAFFKVSGESGRTMHFDASQSCGGTASCAIAQYVWQFNDYLPGGQFPQNYTVVTQSPSVAHTFPRTGNYTVALTTMNADGRSRGYSARVHVDGTPPVISAVSIPSGQTVRSIISSGFKIKSHLSEAGTERGVLQITAAKAQQLGIPRTIGTGTLAFAAAATKTMTMNLTATAKNKLRNQSNLAVTATLSATDRAGNRATAVHKSTTLPH